MCSNGWYYVETYHYLKGGRDTQDYHYVSPDLSKSFVFTDLPPSWEFKNYKADLEMAKWTWPARAKVWLYQETTFVDVEGILDSEDCDLSAELLEKKRGVKLIRVKDLEQRSDVCR